MIGYSRFDLVRVPNPNELKSNKVRQRDEHYSLAEYGEKSSSKTTPKKVIKLKAKTVSALKVAEPRAKATSSLKVATPKGKAVSALKMPSAQKEKRQQVNSMSKTSSGNKKNPREKMTCKKRPNDNKPKGGGGAKRSYVPWC